MFLYKKDDLIRGQIVKRPSKRCKTPYVGDVIKTFQKSFKSKDDNNEEEKKEEEEYLLHTPCLGCGGLCDAGSEILMYPIKTKCKYRAFLSIVKEKNNTIYVGIEPNSAEVITELALKKNYIKELQNIKSYKTQTKIGKSRFDFSGVDENGVEFILEVKNVPCAYYENVATEKERKNIDSSKYKWNDKIGIFPIGKINRKTKTISERALKHIRELEEIKRTTNKRAIICYVIQRNDVKSFEPSACDPIYKSAVEKAIKNGVEMIVLKVKWDNNNNCILY